jgi:hypothetical protein
VSDRFFGNLLKWGAGALFALYVGGRLAIVIQNPPLAQFIYERTLLHTILLLLTVAFIAVVIALFVAETIRRVRRD